MSLSQLRDSSESEFLIMKRDFNRVLPAQIEVVWPRISSALGVFLCTALACIFWIYRSGFPVGLVAAVVCICLAVFCGMNAVFPRKIFVVDFRGIEFSVGAFPWRTVVVPWSEFLIAERGIIRSFVCKSGNRDNYVGQDALRVTFKSTVGFDTAYGSELAHFEDGDTFVIEGSMLGLSRVSIDEAIEIMNALCTKNSSRIEVGGERSAVNGKEN